MGKRKRESAALIKEANKKLTFAKLNNCPTSPRKMRRRRGGQTRPLLR